MIELEKCFLAKSLPDLTNCPSKEIIDVYIPKRQGHAAIRIRKNGDKYVITKKVLADPNNPHKSIEQNIDIDEEEFNILSQTPGKKIHKLRYYYDHNGFPAEVDVFQGPLQGLVMIDFEFNNEADFHNFPTPEFCLIDIRNSDLRHIFAGGMLCGKSYQDIQETLNELNYQKINVDQPVP